MQAVELYYHQDFAILRARGSELLILPQHVTALQKLSSSKEFSEYFMNTALVNRPARKLFQAWLRKDASLWTRLFKLIHDNGKQSAASSELAQAQQTATE
jgi:hypothetical protein